MVKVLSAAARHLNGVSASKMASESVTGNPGRDSSQPTVVIPENIRRVEQAILENRRITYREIVNMCNISLGTVNTILHDTLLFRKVSVRCVPKQLSTFDWHRRVGCCTELKDRYEPEGQHFLDHM
ncbi:uncharacterized protein LOC111623375 [Centruroides sculpturatus]|uniref:uncharacterized protein LOC111623375 n=1 Tax=Centruroides sculpturatus TaxID=218467 RepID=UPI000C6D9390|nr:uncharacterized protein LOC111623375 [Centruroides sculpturatus]